MRSVQETAWPQTRPGGHTLGIHRVRSPAGVLPQAAYQLDTSLPIFDDEILIAVEQLNLDAASFRQLRESCEEDELALCRRVLEITRERGKMENPVTGSGGMLLGSVLQVGERSPHDFRVGEKVATLVSLTLTPLYLEEVRSVDFTKGQLEVKGYAVLFSSGVAARLPQDMVDPITLSLLDVCGAPAWVRKKLKPTDTVLILGMGKAGCLSAAAALEIVPSDSLWVSDLRTQSLERALQCGLAGHAVAADASDPMAFWERMTEAGAESFDLVLNTCNAAGTEAATLLAVKPGKTIVYFNMATSFSRVVLTAEGMGKEAEMLMGNGFIQGHWQYALDLYRGHPGVARFLEKELEG